MQICEHPLINDQIHIKVDVTIPSDWSLLNHNVWAEVLTDQKTWDVSDNLVLLNTHDPHLRSLVSSFLTLSKVILQLGNLPIFRNPELISIAPLEQVSDRYLLKLSLPLIQLIPRSAYQNALKSILDLCLWMAKSPPTDENKNQVFNFIDQKLIKFLNAVVPAGKSTIPVLRIADSLGIPYTHLGLGIYQLGWGSKARRLDRSATELDSAIGARLSQCKILTANLLRLAGLPAPTHFEANSEEEAIQASAILNFPIVVKPSDQDRGEGVTVDITDNRSIKLAFIEAQKSSKSKKVIIEKQVHGICHRLFLVGGKLLYAVKRLPISVKGDGIRTVRQLVNDEVNAQKHKPPWLRSEIKPIDDLALKVISDNGFELESVPKKDSLVPLRRIESTQWGGIDEDVTNTIHPENLSAAVEAAKLFGLDMAGIDIISSDISKPWHENGAIINEVNFVPLFGGAEISRSYIPSFFADFINGKGIIPIEVFETEQESFKRQADLLNQGLRCFYTSSSKTLDSTGTQISMPLQGIKHRVRALVLRKDVDAIVIFLKAP